MPRRAECSYVNAVFSYNADLSPDQVVRLPEVIQLARLVASPATTVAGYVKQAAEGATGNTAAKNTIAWQTIHTQCLKWGLGATP